MHSRSASSGTCEHACLLVSCGAAGELGNLGCDAWCMARLVAVCIEICAHSKRRVCVHGDEAVDYGYTDAYKSTQSDCAWHHAKRSLHMCIHAK